MSKKMPKVKMNESQRKDIRENLNTIDESFDPLYKEFLQIRDKLKNHITILMNLRIFCNKYGTPNMAKQSTKLWNTLDKMDDKLYDIADALGGLRIHDVRDVIRLFENYEDFCKK
jgi:tetrahydromethanopterin S-methyltransferase subunit G